MEQARIRIYMEKPPRGAEKQELEALLARLRAQGAGAECIVLAAGQQAQEPAAAEFLAEAGAAGLPLILVDGEAVVAGRYPAWEEWRIWLDIGGGCGGCGRQAEGCAGCRGCGRCAGR